MKRQDYYPSRIGDQDGWLKNIGGKLPGYGAVLTSISTPDITDGVGNCLWVSHVLNTWLTSVRNFGPATTAALDEVLTGTGAGVMVLPTFTPPALPAGVTPMLPGALTRIFALIARIKLDPGYTEAMGQDLGIIGAEQGEKSSPKLTAKPEQGDGCQCVRLTFAKYGHMGVHLESRRGPAGDWEFLGIDTESPYLDERPLLVAGVPEVREYRARFWDKGTANGEWTDVVKVTVSP
jgi:hypothetical protein